MLSRLFVVFVTLCAAASAHAGAWLQPEGKGLAIGQATYYTTAHYFDANGELQRQPRFTKYEFQPYAEYGVLPNLTIGGTAYLDRVHQSGSSHGGIADPEIFARTRLWSDDRQVISLQPLIKLPSSFSKNDVPRSGSRSTDAELSLLYGRNQPLLTSRDYIDTRIGYRVRNRGQSDQLRVDSSIGLKLTEQVQLVPALRGIMAVNPTDSAAYTENGELDYSLIKAEVTGIYHLDETQWLQASFFKHVAGTQTGDGYGLSLGFARGF